MKAYGGVIVYINIFLTSVLVGDEWSGSLSSLLTAGERTPGTQWVGGWMGLRASLDDVEKKQFLTVPGLELRPLSLPTVASRYSDYAIPDRILFFFSHSLQPAV
jgi:hypothetical protein